MARATINGIEIDYELRGDAGAPAVVITPGGRYPKNSPGVPELADALVAGGKRVLLWDRPNCGLSDVSFDAESESLLHGNTLAGLIRQLDLGPVTLAAGSAGSRVSLIAASRNPELISHLTLWWITGGPIGLMSLATFYCAEPARMLGMGGGMEAVAKTFSWSQVEHNPRARAQLLAQDPDAFIEKMQKWAAAYAPSKDSPVPGMAPEHFAALTMPVLIMRNGRHDLDHSYETTEWVHRLIPHSKLIDAPWREDEWNQLRVERAAGTAAGPFQCWPQAAPLILDFTRS